MPERVVLQKMNLLSDAFLKPATVVACSTTPTRPTDEVAMRKAVRETRRDLRRLRSRLGKSVGVLAVLHSDHGGTEPVGFACAFEQKDIGRTITLHNIGIRQDLELPAGLIEGMAITALGEFRPNRRLSGHRQTRILDLIVRGAFDSLESPVRNIVPFIPESLTVESAQEIIVRGFTANIDGASRVPDFEIHDVRRT